MLNFVRQAVPVPVVFLNYYKPGLLFADLGDAKTVVRWTRNHIGLSCQVCVFIPNTEALVLHYSEEGEEGAGAGCGVRFCAQLTGESYYSTS